MDQETLRAIEEGDACEIVSAHERERINAAIEEVTRIALRRHEVSGWARDACVDRLRAFERVVDAYIRYTRLDYGERRFNARNAWQDAMRAAGARCRTNETDPVLHAIAEHPTLTGALALEGVLADWHIL